MNTDATTPSTPTNPTFAPPAPATAVRPPFQRTGAPDINAETIRSLAMIDQHGGRKIAAHESRGRRSQARKGAYEEALYNRSEDARQSAAKLEAAEQALQASATFEVHGPGRDAISGTTVAAIAFGMIALDLFVDAGALEVLGNARNITLGMATGLAFFQAFLAKFAGVAWARALVTHDPVRRRGEQFADATLSALGIVVALAMAIVRYRYIGGNGFASVAFGAASVGAFLAVRYVSRLHHNPERTAAKLARRRHWWRMRVREVASRRLDRSSARVRGIEENTMAAYRRHLVDPADQVLAARERAAARLGVVIPRFEEPRWLAEARQVGNAELEPRFVRDSLDSRELFK